VINFVLLLKTYSFLCRFETALYFTDPELYQTFKMKVSPSLPFRCIYTLLNHEYLGSLFEAFVVQENNKGELSLLSQKIALQNTSDFQEGLDSTDLELIRLIDQIQPDFIYNRYNKKKLSQTDFFLKNFNKDKIEGAIQESVTTYLEEKRSAILEKLNSKDLFIMGSDGIPTWKKVWIEPEKATVMFHFARNETNTHYFITIRHNGSKLDFQYKNAFLICDYPAWLLVNDRLFQLEENADGKKIKPFLNKKFIEISKSVEEKYYQGFVKSMIASSRVVSKGFEIKHIRSQPKAFLVIGIPQSEAPDQGHSNLLPSFSVELCFEYDRQLFKFDNFSEPANVIIEKKDDDYFFTRIQRNLRFEKRHLDLLNNLQLDLQQGITLMSKPAIFSWLHQHRQILEEENIIVQQNNTDSKRYFLGQASMNISIEEKNDWFDVRTKVRFGETEIPFFKLRHYILNHIREFRLPNGEVAVIPEVWFSDYSELFAFTKHTESDTEGRLELHHLNLVQDLSSQSLAVTVMGRRLENLRNFEKIKPYPLPEHLSATLRPYQEEGFRWLKFLNEYRLGGCLADDMGLGKTLQTLALLQSCKEAGNRKPSLLVMPTSLLYNWKLEAARFTPQLKVMQYTGTSRVKDTSQFEEYDLILTSYGIIRLDIEILSKYSFHYIILDESQAIKNPASIISKSVRLLWADHRLILTGTPVENNTMDLWTQMTFINPGLLGSERFFRKNFQFPIEKKNDEEKIRKLYGLIKPFILRRNKSQVATDLPEKIESIEYCEMTPEQEKQYEETKSYYRNMLLEQMTQDALPQFHMLVLEGLTKLRQIANHPVLTEASYSDDSGKFNNVINKIETVLSENHKILIFSQYIKHLQLFRTYLDEQNIRFAYLDGSTRDRQQQVEQFQEDPDTKVFLISIKAGGQGLNLTAAEYVFILDPWWNPAVEAQAIDRAHRIGQKQTVFTYKFISRDTVEEKILQMQQNKRQLAGELILHEEGFFKSLSRNDILSLLE